MFYYQFCTMAWKIKVMIESKVHPKKNGEESKVIVKFVGDKNQYKHEIYFFDSCPFQSRIRKFETWMFEIKVKSITFKEQDGTESYHTILYCEKIYLVSDMIRK